MTTAGPKPAASAEEVEAAWNDNKLAQVLYHDWEASTYDEKWSISYDERCVDYARDRFTDVAGSDGWPYGKSLEIGAGTGFFTLNLKLAGVLAEAHVTDLSPGMVEAAKRNADTLGFAIEGKVADAEKLPYDDDTFDLVIGHAVIHHIPDVELAFREMLRVLKPGGRFVICGEPTRYGDFVARRLSRLTWWATTNVTKLPALSHWRRPQSELDESSRAAALEAVVDLHTFDPDTLARTAERAGATDVRTVTEELLAAWVGWPIRTFEAAVPEEQARVRLADVRLQVVAAALQGRQGARSGSPGRALLQRVDHRGSPVGHAHNGRMRLLTAANLRWVVRHRAWTPYYLKRYWRFAMFKLRHPQVITEGFVFLGKKLEIVARPGHGRLILGKWVHLGDETRLRAHEGTLRIGDKVVFARDVTVNCYLDIEIGASTLIADWTYICDFDHKTEDLELPIKDQGLVKSPVRIGPDCWLATKVTVTRGADIGRGVVIGANSVARGNIPAYSVAVGVPAVVVRDRVTRYEAEAERREYLAKLAHDNEQTAARLRAGAPAVPARSRRSAG